MLGINEEQVNSLLQQFMPQIDAYITQKIRDELNKMLPPLLDQIQQKIAEIIGPSLPKPSVEPPVDGQDVSQVVNPQLAQLAIIAQLFKAFAGSGETSGLDKLLETASKIAQLYSIMTPRDPWAEVGPTLLVKLLEKSLSKSLGLDEETKKLIHKLKGEEHE